MYSYWHHVARRYHALADHELFLKATAVRPKDVEAMLLAAASGTFKFNSHPWLGPGGVPLTGRRRVLNVACHDAWKVRLAGDGGRSSGAVQLCCHHGAEPALLAGTRCPTLCPW